MAVPGAGEEKAALREESSTTPKKDGTDLSTRERGGKQYHPVGGARTTT